MHCFSLGLEIAGQITIGYTIGEGNMSLAKRYRNVLTAIGAGFSITTTFIIIAFRWKIAFLYTDDPNLQEKIA